MHLALRLHRISCWVLIAISAAHLAAHIASAVQGPAGDRERRLVAAL